MPARWGFVIPEDVNRRISESPPLRELFIPEDVNKRRSESRMPPRWGFETHEDVKRKRNESRMPRRRGFVTHALEMLLLQLLCC